MLTKNIPYFEDSGNSGQYRNCEVWIGHDLCPHYLTLSNLMDQWLQVTNKLIDLNYQDKYLVDYVLHQRLIICLK